jgi:hypothetical protein
MLAPPMVPVNLISVVLRAVDAQPPILPFAFAYIDPIGGSLFIQAIIAGVLGALATVKGSGSAIKRTFRRIWRRRRG